MAHVVTVALVDDLDGSPADETITFGLDGQFFEIDLSRDHAALLRSKLRQFVVAARHVGGHTHFSPVRRSTPTDPALSNQNRIIRTWARLNNRTVAAEGSLPRDLVEAYHRERLGWRPSVEPGLLPTSTAQTASDVPAGISRGRAGESGP